MTKRKIILFAGAAVVLTGIIAASLILTKGRHSEVKGSQEVTTERKERKVIMDQQKKEINLTKEEIQEMIKDLEPGTMITVEMPIEITDTGKEPG